MAQGPQVAGWENFDRQILLRGGNLLKATVLLVDQLHWEVAASSARQMFELVLNMESLAAMPNRERGSFRYAMFGLLQQARAQIVRDEYERAAGRPVDEERARKVAALLASPSFETFKGRARADGTFYWVESWNGLTTKKMAAASPNPLRRSQYEQLFTQWSEETHGSPAALIPSMFRAGGPDWVGALLVDDLRQSSQIAAMALFLFSELWHSLVNAPPFPAKEWQAWIDRVDLYIQDKWGSEMPDLWTVKIEPESH